MKKNDDVVIQLIGITKQYTIHHEKPTLVEKIIKNKTEEFLALNNINLEIRKGENVGIIGPNGSGKTTLLKVITGITTPTKGIVQTVGRIVSLIDLEAGFHPDLTGEQNIYLNGMIIGMGKNEISQKLKSIIKFADLQQFIDVPIRTYSSGMLFRLGFSVGVHANPDILILDEGLSVGDRWFQEKATIKLSSFYKQKKTIITVTHWLDFLKKNSTRIVYLSNGRIIQDGGLNVLDEYIKRKL